MEMNRIEKVLLHLMLRTGVKSGLSKIITSVYCVRKDCGEVKLDVRERKYREGREKLGAL
jgi:hypothetical protein